MRTAVHWIASIAGAGVILFLLVKFLPAEMSRLWLITISGLAGILWCYFIDLPLKAWAQDR